MSPITATLEKWKEPPLGSMNKWRKEKHFTRQLTCVAIVGGEVVEIAQARTYGTAAASYCCIWIMTDGGWRHGGAVARGYGYHRYSEAMDTALQRCGVKLSQSIGGVGDNAMEDALAAVGRAMGFDKVQILKAHG